MIPSLSISTRSTWDRGKQKKAFFNHPELAVELARYCQEMGYTHVELLPIQEHPLDESWGYPEIFWIHAVTSR